MGTQDFTAGSLDGRTVVASDGEKLGKVDGLLEDETGTPRYLEVRSGWFGSRRHVVPLEGVSTRDGDVVLPYTQEQLRAAPTLEEHEHLTYQHERAMGEHYGVDVRVWDDERDGWMGATGGAVEQGRLAAERYQPAMGGDYLAGSRKRVRRMAGDRGHYTDADGVQEIDTHRGHYTDTEEYDRPSDERGHYTDEH